MKGMYLKKKKDPYVYFERSLTVEYVTFQVEYIKYPIIKIKKPLIIKLKKDELKKFLDERLDEYYKNIKIYLLIAIDSDPYIIKKIKTQFPELRTQFSEIYEYAVKSFIKLFKEKGWYKSNFFKYIPQEELHRILNNIYIFDIWFLCNKNESFFKYLSDDYKMINCIVKYMHEHGKMLHLTINDLKLDTELNIFCLKEYLKGNEPELSPYITTEFIMALFNNYNVWT